jgi:hypothetical protein
MKALMIRDLPRNDELRAEAMKAVTGGIGARSIVEETREPATGSFALGNSVGNALDGIFKAAAVAAQKVG